MRRHVRNISSSSKTSTTSPADEAGPSAGVVDPAFRQAGTTLQHDVSNDGSAINATTESIAARIPNLRDPKDANKLTPLRAHYLKKTLVRLQVEKEVDSLTDKGE